MRVVRVLFGSHLFALAFGLAGLLIVLPHPELWAGNPTITQALPYGLNYTGSIHIIFGAATMLAFGLAVVGRRKTLIFFAVATLLPLCAELLGTGTGFPFGAYSYTTGLGFKVGGRVPYSIPLSWFYMGFTSYLLATVLIARLGLRNRTWWALALGAYLLTAWDLVLDPAMASRNLPIRFWIWHQGGAYFGMPLQNFIGWGITGFIFMAVSRFLWGENLRPRQIPAWLPFGMYAANIVFAIFLSAGAGLWQPPIIAVVLGLVPAAVAWRGSRTMGAAASAPESPVELVARRVLRSGSAVIAARSLDVSVEGLEHLPTTGPVLIASRHFHHLDDGVIFLTRLPRAATHILVGLDWVGTPAARRLMELACRVARWPIVLRSSPDDLLACGLHTSAYSPTEAARYLRHAVRTATEVLRAGHVLVVFPEAYPNVDPVYTPKADLDTFLPFRAGFVKLAEIAERDHKTHVAIVPAGLHYQRMGERWQVTLRLGAPIALADWPDRAALVRHMEAQVQALSAPAASREMAAPQQVLQS